MKYGKEAAEEGGIAEAEEYKKASKREGDGGERGTSATRKKVIMSR